MPYWWRSENKKKKKKKIYRNEKKKKKPKQVLLIAQLLVGKMFINTIIIITIVIIIHTKSYKKLIDETKNKRHFWIALKKGRARANKIWFDFVFRFSLIFSSKNTQICAAHYEFSHFRRMCVTLNKSWLVQCGILFKIWYFIYVKVWTNIAIWLVCLSFEKDLPKFSELGIEFYSL